MSLFIALEGADASGKFSQTKRLEKYYTSVGKRVIRFAMPEYESISGEMVAGYLKADWTAILSPDADVKKYTKSVSSYAFQCCHLVNKLESMPESLWRRKPFAADGPDDDIVFIADRFNASAYAYGHAAGVDVDWLINVYRHLPQPDINIYLDIPIEESFRRRPERRDEYEKNSALLERVRNSYIDIFKRLDVGGTYNIIDANCDEEAVFQKLLIELISFENMRCRHGR